MAVDTQNNTEYQQFHYILSRQINADAITMTQSAVSASVSIVVGTDKLYLTSNIEVDNTAQKAQLEKDLEYQKGFLKSVEIKLSNEKFVSNAKPEVIAAERKKQSDAIAKIKTLEESLGMLQ